MHIQQKNKIRSIITIILAIIITILLNLKYIYKDNALQCAGGNSLQWIMICGFVYIIFDKYLKIEKEKRLKVVGIIFGCIIAFLEVIGTLAQEIWRNTSANFTLNICTYIILKFIAYMPIMTAIFTIICDRLKNKKDTDNEQKEEVKSEKTFFTSNIKSFLIVWGILVIAYLPWYLNYFPGTTSFDTNYQLMQGFGIYNYTNHHPVLHTFIISNVIKCVSDITGSFTIAFGTLSLIQLILSAAVFSFIIYYMAKKNIKTIYRILALIFFALTPFIGQLNIAIWKDTPFSLLVLLMIIPLIELVTNKENFLKSKWKIIFTIILFSFVPFFKNTGIYILAITYVVVLTTNIKNWKSISIMFGIPIILYLVISGPVFNKMKIEQTESAEFLTVPIQQMARLEKYRSAELTENEKELIHKYIQTDEISKRYNPTIVDMVKEKFANQTFKENKVEFIKLFLHFTLKFPDETIAAFVCNSFGYYYPEVETYALGSDTYETPLNEQQFMKVKKSPIIEIGALENIRKAMYEKDIPIISLIANLGAYFWILVGIFFINIYYKNYKLLIAFVPYIVVFLTAIASPVSGELRYVYPMLLSLPILTIFTLELIEKVGKEKSEK